MWITAHDPDGSDRLIAALFGERVPYVLHGDHRPAIDRTVAVDRRVAPERSAWLRQFFVGVSGIVCSRARRSAVFSWSSTRRTFASLIGRSSCSRRAGTCAGMLDRIGRVNVI